MVHSPHIPQQVREPVPVDVTGAASQADRRYAVEKIRSLAQYAGRPVKRAHVILGKADDRSPARRARSPRVQAVASLDVDGRPVNAKATGATAHEAVDRLRQRLYAQLAWRKRPLRAAYAWVSRSPRRP
ncbi:MAG TPA: HPF/RaiA family ribosome-associated protein [Thermoleophilia bacterium]|jgi:ribosome-associated translation inhibitor RaiA|nr:HPF/RaiA family ribosome-associated protein [Thermoleophilia bacterium]